MTYGDAPYSPWRVPDEETTDLYPGLVVWDERQSGSITVGQSRLPVRTLTGTAIKFGWDEVEGGWGPGEHYGWTEDDQIDFLHHLLEARGELARLLLVLADVQRIEGGWHELDGRGWLKSWWDDPELRERVVDQLRRCVTALTDDRSER